jgi:hypothetical protein
MNQWKSRSTAAKLNVAGLVLAAAGIALERGAGSTLYPTLALPVVLVVAAALVAFRPGRWTAYVGLIVSLVLAAGLIVSVALARTFLDQLADTGNAGTLVGSILHVVGLVAAVAGGIGIVRRLHRDSISEAGPD